MKNTVKLIVISFFALGALFMFLSSNTFSGIGEAFSLAAADSLAAVEPTPPKNKKSTKPTSSPTAAAKNTPSAAATKSAPTAAATSAPTAAAAKSTPTVAATSAPTAAAGTPSGPPAVIPTGSKTIQKIFMLAENSASDKYGKVEFDHNSHAFMKYSADGNSGIACIECHHTDQPHPKPPDVKSERTVVLTFEEFQKSNQAVTHCLDCHFQPGSEPDGKSIPKLAYDWDKNGKITTKKLDNYEAYHLNCNTCHDLTFAARPGIKTTNKKFARGSDCTTCHQKPTS